MYPDVIVPKRARIHANAPLHSDLSQGIPVNAGLQTSDEMSERQDSQDTPAAGKTKYISSLFMLFMVTY